MKFLRAWASMRLVSHLAWFFLIAVFALFIAAHLVSNPNTVGLMCAIAVVCLALAFLLGIKASPEK